MMLVHATTVALGQNGVLLRGPPGSGKSDLALRLIEQRQCGLIADDQTDVFLRGKGVWARCPPALRGRIEVRGLGIVKVKPHRPCKVSLIVDLVGPGNIERMPDRNSLKAELLSVVIARIELDPFQASAPARVRAALRHLLLNKS